LCFQFLHYIKHASFDKKLKIPYRYLFFQIDNSDTGAIPDFTGLIYLHYICAKHGAQYYFGAIRELSKSSNNHLINRSYFQIYAGTG
ncbi:MAG: hypothetical protein LJE83_07805, partial [Gammaproteobacteria bacterium]|nr:hypothetical protein [Gammaproteobacteria bacterium]